MTNRFFFLLTGPAELSWTHVSSHSQIQMPLSETCYPYGKGRKRKDSRWSTWLFKLQLGETAIIFTHLTSQKHRTENKQLGINLPVIVLCCSDIPHPSSPVLHTTGAQARYYTFLQLPLPELCATVYNTLWVFWSYHGRLRCPSFKQSSYWPSWGL